MDKKNKAGMRLKEFSREIQKRLLLTIEAANEFKLYKRL